jgi:tetratricopeptide (TPR) repeat protein
MSTRLKAPPVTQPATQTAVPTAEKSDQFKRAVKLHQQGDVVAAEAMYKALLLNEPGNLQVTYLLGLIGSQTQRPELARENIEKYLNKYPEDAQAISILALVYYDLKDYSKACSFLEKSIAKRGDSPHLYYNLGKTHFELKSFEAAVKAYDTAIRLQPGYIDALLGKAVSHQELKESEAAACTLEHAIVLEPYRAEAHFLYGNVMRAMGEIQAAIDAFETALTLKPDYIDAAVNCGSAFKDLDRMEDALRLYNHALAMDPYHPEANYNKAIALLADGQLARGWMLYEWRKKSALTLDKFLDRELVDIAPEWDGKALDGHLLVTAEQGLGDQIFFAGMLNDLSAYANRVTVSAEARLLPLLKRSFPLLNFIEPKQVHHTNEFDAQVYMGSLGQSLRSTTSSLTNIPSPYLHADAELTASLRAQMPKDGKILCGISWASKNVDHGREKSLTLNLMSQFICLNNIHAVDLQYGDTSDERQSFLQTHNKSIQKIDDVDNTDDLDGLAALIAACDIVVTVSNTTAHLAAALGKPVLVMLPQSSAVFWYWHRQGDKSPWYPTARLFRKEEIGDWPSVIDAVTLTLAGIA